MNTLFKSPDQRTKKATRLLQDIGEVVTRLSTFDSASKAAGTSVRVRVDTETGKTTIHTGREGLFSFVVTEMTITPGEGALDVPHVTGTRIHHNSLTGYRVASYPPTPGEAALSLGSLLRTAEIAFDEQGRLATKPMTDNLTAPVA